MPVKKSGHHECGGENQFFHVCVFCFNKSSKGVGPQKVRFNKNLRDFHKEGRVFVHYMNKGCTIHIEMIQMFYIEGHHKTFLP